MSRKFSLIAVCLALLAVPATGHAQTPTPDNRTLASPVEMPGGPQGILVWPCGRTTTGYCCLGRASACGEFYASLK
jgi:hypothetical protein